MRPVNPEAERIAIEVAEARAELVPWKVLEADYGLSRQQLWRIMQQHETRQRGGGLT